MHRSLLFMLACVAVSVVFVSMATASNEAQSTKKSQDANKSLKVQQAQFSEKLENYPGSEWLSQNGDLSNSRYSTLNQINTGNVGSLKLAWQEQLNNGLFTTDEAFPLVFGDIMLTTAGSNVVDELQADTGKLIRTITGPTNVSRGVTLGGGMLFANNGTNAYGAWNIYTGAQVWKTVFSVPPGSGKAPSEGPNAIYWNHMIFLSSGGNDGQVIGGGVNGFMSAYNADTGAPVWQWSIVPQKVGDPGASTWGNPAELGNGGGGDWEIGAIDPQNDLLYFGTGNAEPYYGRSPGNDLFTSSLVALDLKSGQLKWYFQEVHHDEWDYDCPEPPLLWNHMFNGKMTQGIEVGCKTGYYFEFNRVTGKPLIPIKEKPIPNASNTAAMEESNASPTQPVPAGQSPIPHCVTPADLPGPAPDGQPWDYECTFATFGSDKYTAITPSPLNAMKVMSFSPQTGYVYSCDAIGVIGLKADPANGPSAFFSTNGPATTAVTSTGTYPFPNSHKLLGVVAALNIQNNKIVWEHKWYADHDGVCYGGTTATAGGLVFASSQQGWLYAYDAKTGKQLYSSQR